MKMIEIVVVAENVQEVKDALTSNGIETRSIKDIEAVDRVINKPKAKKPCCGQGEKKSPSISKKAKNYANTMRRWGLAGMPKVNLNTYANRLLICSICPELIEDTECSKCGCPMKDKAIMDIDKLCELNKW